MPLFPFKSNAHFVTSSDGTILQVYELTKPTNQLPFVKKADWKQVTTITASLEEEDDDEKEEEEASDEKSYNGLAFFDGHGKIEGEKALTTLAQHLKQLHLLVNPKGYCFQDVSDLGMYSDFGIHYLRLNDLFSWPCHKIDLTTSNVWGRLELKYNSPSKRQGPSPKSSKPSVGGGVSKEKYAKLEMLVKEKDEELEKLKEEMEEANVVNEKEQQKLKKAYEDQHKQVQKILKKKKDDEDAKTKRIEELEKLNEELEDATKAKDEELEKVKKDKDEEIRKILKKKEVELRALKSKKDDEEEKSRRIEELEKTIEEMEVANMARDEELLKLKKGKNEELQKALREKNHELRVLEKKKEDEKNNAEAKAKKAEGELQEVKDKLSFSVDEVEQVNKELEQCRKLSWAILPSTSFLPQSADAKEKYLTRRQRIAPEKLVCNALLSFPYVTNSPKLVDNMYNWSSNRVRLVDEESSSSTWPAPPNLDIRIGRGVLDFDRNNWWYVKTTHPEGGLTMLVYYDGNQSQLTLASPSCIVPLPYAKGVEFITYTYRLSLFDLTPLGFRLGFTYRPA
ncbi:hypothetical protein LINGRAHAP2_LOCUS8140 [Linum grandiflorum]